MTEKTNKNDLPAIPQKTKRNDFIEIDYTGYANGQLFDSNIEEEVKKLNPEAKGEETIIIIGEGMVVPGLDKALEGKEIGKDYEVEIKANEGFGERRRDLIRTLPLSAFREQKVYPQLGMILALDSTLVKIIAVSGARITADFNNPMSGKDLKYNFKIKQFVTDERKKTKTLLQLYFKADPEFEINDKEVIVKGPKIYEELVKHYNEKFKDLIGKNLKFEEKKEEEPKKAEISEETQQAT